MTPEQGVTLLILLAVQIVIFIVCREIVCWYFKINQRLNVMKDIRDYLKKDEPTFISEFKKAYKEGELGIEDELDGLRGIKKLEQD